LDCALGQKLDQLFDAPAAREARCAIAAGAGLTIQAVILAAANHVQAGVCVALNREQLVVRVEILLVNRHAERAPKQLAIGPVETFFAFIGQRTTE
jgi:hypothetical protein